MKIKDIPSKKLTGAVKAMNAFLEEDKQPKIVFVGVSKKEKFKNLESAMDKYIEDSKAELLPKQAVEFYNNYIANSDESDTDTDTDTDTSTDEKPPKKKKDKGKGKKGKGKDKEKSKDKSKDKPKDKDKPKKKKAVSGKVEFIVKAIVDDGIKGHKEIQAHLKKKYDIECSPSTISHVSCVLGHVIDRLK